MSIFFSEGRLTIAGHAASMLVATMLAPLCAMLALATYICRYVYGRLALGGSDLTVVTGEDMRTGLEPDTPNCMINGGTFVEYEADVEVFRRHVESACVLATDDQGERRFPKLRQTLHRKAGYMVWRDDPNFKMENHVYGHHLTTSGNEVRSERELENLLNQLFNRLLPENRPQWEFIVIHLAHDWRGRRYPHDLDAIPRSVIALRFNHTIMDGMTLVRFCCEIVSSTGGRVPAAMQRMLPQWKPPSQHPFISRGIRLVTCAITFAFAPYEMFRGIFERDVTFLQSTPPTKHKHYTWSNPLSFDRIKAIKSATGTTVNDVLMSIVASAVSRYFAARQQKAPASLQTIMPITLQRLDRPILMKNDFLSVFIPLCTEAGLDPLARLKKTRRNTSRIKSSMSPVLHGVLVPFLCHVIPAWLMRRLCSLGSPSVIYSNVPGPDIDIHITNDRIVQLMAVTPNFCLNGFSFTCISYLKSMTVALTMDSGISSDIQDARDIIGYVEEELERLADALSLSGTNPIQEKDIAAPRESDVKERVRQN